MHIRLGLVSTLAACAGLAAQDSFIVGPRALGMGGAAVACADDQVAQYYNPALFGFFHQRDDSGGRLPSDNNDLGRKRWGIGLIDVNAGVESHGDLLDRAQQISDVDIGSLGQNGIVTAQDVDDAVKLVGNLAALDDPGNAFTADASASVTVRIGHVGIGARVFSQVSGLVKNVDLVNVGFAASGSALATNINSSGAPDDGTITAFSSAQSTQLITDLGGGANATQAVQQLDFAMRQQGLSQAEIDNVFAAMDAAALGTGNFDNNTTTVRLAGFALGEIPITYGYAFDEHLSIGATVNVMFGRVYGTEVSVFDDNATTSFGDAAKEYHQSVNVGLDLGIAWRTRWLQLGLTGRNLNGPTFAGFTTKAGLHLGDVKVDPQVTAGVALIPRSWVTLALDADLLKADTVQPGYQTQRVGAGLEFTPGHVVALRVGTYKNLAEDDIGQVVTAGLGLNLWAVRIDLAGAAALESTEVDGKDMPKEMRAALGVMCDF